MLNDRERQYALREHLKKFQQSQSVPIQPRFILTEEDREWLRKLNIKVED